MNNLINQISRSLLLLFTSYCHQTESLISNSQRPFDLFSFYKYSEKQYLRNLEDF
jgi:hypothetical protein